MALNPVYLFRSAGNPGISLPARPLFSGNLTSAVWSCWLHDPNWESAPPQMHNMALDVDDSALAPATWWSFGIGFDNANSFGVAVLRQPSGGASEIAWSVAMNAPAPWPACTTHMLASIDFLTFTVQVYVNDVPVSVANVANPPAAWFTAGIPLTNTALDEHFPGTHTTTAYVSDLWFGQTPSFVDLTVTANRRKFVNADLTPANLGPTGALPFGTAPTVFQQLPEGSTTASDWLINRGAAGGTLAANPGTATGAYGNPCADEPPPPPDVFLTLDDVQVRTIPTPPCQLFLDWSDDRAHSFGSPVGQPMGALGEYRTFVQWQRLGVARDRVWRLTWSCPRPTALQGAWIELTAAKS